MFQTGTPVSARRKIPGVALLVVGIALFIAIAVAPRNLFAQHGGGGGAGGGMGGGSMGGGAGRPGGISEKDDLKIFHRAMAVQASPEQRAAFAKIAEYTDAASNQLQSFRDSLQKDLAPALPDRATGLSQAIEKARSGNQNFLTSLSSTQKSDLKDLTGKLEKADSDLDKQIKALDQIAHDPKPDGEQLTGSVANVEKALTGFQNEQLALGAEMSILFSPTSQGLAFSLPQVTNSVSIGGGSISIPASGTVSKTSAENGHNLFDLKLVADLSDLQQNITPILRLALNRSPRCGERIGVQQASLTPQAPASLVVAHFNFERWMCPPGGQSPMELSAGDGEIEVKLTLSVDQKAGLQVSSEIAHVEATGFLRDMLRTGDLGTTLREQIAASILSVMQKGADLNSNLPPVAHGLSTIQNAQFQDAGAEQLGLVLDGQLQFSDEQAKQFAIQLKQPLSAHGTSPK